MSFHQFAVVLVLVMAVLLFVVGIAEVEDSPYQETEEEWRQREGRRHG